MATTVSPALLRHQRANILAMFGVGLRSALPFGRGAPPQTPTPPIRRRLRPVPGALIDAYADWTGAPRERYVDVLPAPLFSHWGLGLISELAGQSHCNLLSAVNQGCRMVTRTLLPAGEPIEVSGCLSEIDDDGRRIRLTTRLEVGTVSAPDAQTIEVIAAIPRRNPKGRRQKQDHGPEPAFETIGHWSAAAGDGIDFALLTGDFNPLHTCPPLGRRTRYGGCILHGFGQMSRTWEALQDAGIEIAEFDIRFVKPVRLPTDNLEVQLARETSGQGGRELRLRSPDGTVHLVGQLREPAPYQP